MVAVQILHIHYISQFLERLLLNIGKQEAGRVKKWLMSW